MFRILITVVRILFILEKLGYSEVREKDCCRTLVDKFRRTLPLITDLKNAAMRPRHWRKVKDAIGRDFDETSDAFTLEVIAEMQLQNFAEQISDISNAATMELAIEVVSKLVLAFNHPSAVKSGWLELALTMSLVC